jgi:hypothetical protein
MCTFIQLLRQLLIISSDFNAPWPAGAKSLALDISVKFTLGKHNLLVLPYVILEAEQDTLPWVR